MPKDSSKLLWIAGGIGVTPFISQMQYLLDSNDLERNIVLLHGLRQLDEDPCKGLVETCCAKMSNFRRVIVLSEQPPKDWSGETGYIDQALITRNVSDYLERQCYVSGPEPMVDAMKDMLVEMGLPESQIHQDWFPGYKEKY